MAKIHTYDEEVKLGGSDLMVTRLGIGTWSWGTLLTGMIPRCDILKEIDRVGSRRRCRGSRPSSSDGRGTWKFERNRWTSPIRAPRLGRRRGLDFLSVKMCRS